LQKESLHQLLYIQSLHQLFYIQTFAVDFLKSTKEQQKFFLGKRTTKRLEKILP